MINILFEHQDFIVIEKPSGLAVESKQAEEQTVLTQLASQEKSGLWIVHRIDQPVSGLMILGKSKAAAKKLQNFFQSGKVKKTYLALSDKKEMDPSGRLVHYLRKDGKKNKSYAFDKALHHTKKSILDYQILGQSDTLQCLEIHLQTGRHHQIRSQLGAIGIPVRGDVKYGYRRSNKDRRIHLHAWKIGWNDPDFGLMEWTADLPDDSIWKLFEHLTESV